LFHSSLGPVIEIGLNWPPTGIISIKAMEVPLLNTAILLTSAISLTWSHHAIINNKREEGIIGIGITIGLGIIFTVVQGLEYVETTFTFADSIFGAVFFLATGFHGLHVIIGTIFLIVTATRLINHHYTTGHHVGFEAAAWYWHFVDYVWLFLFVCIYWWGS
jgi:cytochrome c oxidase subunit 3